MLTFTAEILNGKLHFLCSDIHLFLSFSPEVITMIKNIFRICCMNYWQAIISIFLFWCTLSYKIFLVIRVSIISAFVGNYLNMYQQFHLTLNIHQQSSINFSQFTVGSTQHLDFLLLIHSGYYCEIKDRSSNMPSLTSHVNFSIYFCW